MSFCHVRFQALLADLSLQPLSAAERDVLEHAASDTEADGTICLAARRLSDFGLVCGDDEATPFLIAIRDRGLLPQLLETRK